MTTLAGLLPKLVVFLVAVVVGGSAAFVGASVLGRQELAPTAREAPEYVMAEAGLESVPAAFDLIDAQQQPVVVPGLAPADLALASAALVDAQPVAGTRPLGFPRIPPVTQFDGGPFQGANCTLASGAMLARLGFGIVTTGSILRTLQDDQVGGVGLDDLDQALFRGFGVDIRTGAVTPSQLKGLLAAGYGAVIQGIYGEIPASIRLQPSFTGPHAVYLDGYYPGDGITPPAYYVIDPIGHGGYQGDWWPASIVDAFGQAFSGSSRILAAWVFPPGGTPPDVVGPDVLPLPPSGGGAPASPAPGESPISSAPPEAGDEVPPEPPELSDPPVVGPSDIGDLEAIPVLEICLDEPRPPGCPGGIEGVFEIPFPDLEVLFGPRIEIVGVDSDRPNVALVAFTLDPPSSAEVRFWEADGSPAVIQTASSLLSLPFPGATTIVARLDVLASTSYHFQVVAGGGLFGSSSPVGTFTTGSGVLRFDLDVAVAAEPVFELGEGLSPYLHLAQDALVQPFIRTDVGSPEASCLARTVDFGDVAYCLPEAAAFQGVCNRVTVAYELEGIEATGVLVRAYPQSDGRLPSGDPTLAGIIEAQGPAGSGEVEVGCLASGLTYTVALDAVGDDLGNLITRTVVAP